MMKKYNYTIAESENISFGGTTINYVYVNATYDMPVNYEMPVAGSLDTTRTNKK